MTGPPPSPPSPPLPPLRVEQALRLLPEVDALAPLRAFLISSSRRSGPREEWARSEQYRTIGKWFLQPAELRARVPQTLGLVTDHLNLLYDAVLEALECEQRGDLSGAVRALLRAGRREERVARYSQARVWYEHALGVGEQLRDRRPEIEALRALGELDRSLGHAEAAARRFQRALVLADAEMDREGAILACRGLGDAARDQGAWQGAESWYTRGLRLAEGDAAHTARLLRRQGEAARGKGDLDGAADRLRQAAELLAGEGDPQEMVRVLAGQGVLEARRGRHAEAAAGYALALKQLAEAGGDPALELRIRLSLSELHLDKGRFLEAEDELRRGEELAITHNLARQLARIYTLLGQLRGRQGDEDGFVFFEKAIELCRGPEAAPRLEARVYHEYARFRLALGERDEARAYLERARELLESVGPDPELDAVRADLVRL